MPRILPRKLRPTGDIVGSEDYLRAVAANSWDVAGGTWLAAGELRRSDGPWDNPEDVRLLNGFLKYTTRLWGREAEFIATAYDNDWSATDQIPKRAIDDGRFGRFAFVDPSVGGATSRINLIANVSGQDTRYNVFASAYELNLYGNPTYFLNDPANGDQIEQEDRRTVVGGRVDSRRLVGASGAVTLEFGGDLRFDRIDDVNLFRTSNRRRLSTVRNDAVDELSVGLYAQVEYALSERLRATLGLRADHFSWDVDAARRENSGSGSATNLDPKLGLAFAPNDAWEFYLNYGGGFHSNDVRAAELSVDPGTGVPAESFDAIVEAEGAEIGFRAQLSEQLNFSATLFHLELDSELIFVGDAGTTEPNDGTERNGIEATLFWQPLNWLVLDATAAKTDAKFKDAPSGEDRIPDAHDFVAGFGTTVSLPNGFAGSLRVRHFGDAPLLEDNSVQKSGTTLVNLRLSYPLERLEFGLDVLNVLDSDGNDIEYLYESRLPGEPAGIEDLHVHPVESREFRLRLRYTF